MIVTFDGTALAFSSSWAIQLPSASVVVKAVAVGPWIFMLAFGIAVP